MCFSSLNDPENGVHHYKCCLPEGDDGWLHQPCCLLIKWLLLNSNLPVWCSSKPHWLDPSRAFHFHTSFSLISLLRPSSATVIKVHCFSSGLPRNKPCTVKSRTNVHSYIRSLNIIKESFCFHWHWGKHTQSCSAMKSCLCLKFKVPRKCFSNGEVLSKVYNQQRAGEPWECFNISTLVTEACKIFDIIYHALMKESTMLIYKRRWREEGRGRTEVWKMTHRRKLKPPTCT